MEPFLGGNFIPGKATPLTLKNIFEKLFQKLISYYANRLGQQHIKEMELHTLVI